jgi:hypothetical protein
MLLHPVEDLLKGPLEIGLVLFNVSAVAHEVLSHCHFLSKVDPAAATVNCCDKLD